MKLQLKRIRKEKKLSQTNLANLIGANIRTIGAWERGETMMSIEQLCRCCEILGSTPNEMTGWYIEHPEDAPGKELDADPRRRSMLDSYDALTDDGKTLASEMVASVARDPLRRADAAGAGSAGHGAAPHSEELSA